MEPKYIKVLIIGLIGIILTIIRRYKNKDRNAGCAVAGWTLFLAVYFLVD